MPTANRGMRRRHQRQKLIVAGCMAQRFAGELGSSMPEVDAFIGLDQLTRIAPIIEGLLAKERVKAAPPENFVTPAAPLYSRLRHASVPPHPGSYRLREKSRRGATIPAPFASSRRCAAGIAAAPSDSIVAETRALVAEGVKELNLISQDTTYFGMDRWAEKAGPRALVDSSRGDSLVYLLRELQKIEGDFWIRLLYTHPAHWSDELIRTIAECPKVARYVDMPLQHISDPMLERHAA